MAEDENTGEILNWEMPPHITYVCRHCGKTGIIAALSQCCSTAMEAYDRMVRESAYERPGTTIVCVVPEHIWKLVRDVNWLSMNGEKKVE
jgi:hypothetical protein